MTDIFEFRKLLHANPELSNQEIKTSGLIIKELKSIGVTKIFHGFSGYSILAEIDSNEVGPMILFRCELDALPIVEENNFAHRSINEGIAHLCGHDGHVATMLRFAQKLMANPFKKGKILLFFQSAEEIGLGAKEAINSGIFDAYAIDFVFAYHNIPGFELGKILSKKGLFTPCVESCRIDLKGQNSHASEPHKGINPALALAEIIQLFDTYNQPDKVSDDFFIATPIHIEMGERAYGISAGQASIGYTFRAWDMAYFENIKSTLIKQVNNIADSYKLTMTINWLETFKANVNDQTAYKIIKNATKKQHFAFLELEKPFEFGEDFGLFTTQFKGAMFGIGSGENHAALHTKNYDFPDELIEIGSDVFIGIVAELSN